MPAYISKKQGELAELLFAAKASSLGLTVSRPWGDSDPFDFIVSHDRHMARVQVRSAAFGGSDGFFRIRIDHHGRRYSAEQIDAYVVYVMPADAWYVIPWDAIKRARHVSLAPFQTRSRSKFERFREAWHLLLPGCPKFRRSRRITESLPPHLRPRRR